MAGAALDALAREEMERVDVRAMRAASLARDGLLGFAAPSVARFGPFAERTS